MLRPSHRLPTIHFPPPPPNISRPTAVYYPSSANLLSPYYPPPYLSPLPNISRLTTRLNACLLPYLFFCLLPCLFPCLPSAPSIFYLSPLLALNISRRIACLLPAMRLSYYPTYSSAYLAPRDCPPLADTHFPPRGDGPMGRAAFRSLFRRAYGASPGNRNVERPFWGKGQEEPSYLSFLPYPPYYYFTYYFFTIENTPFLYTYK